MKILLLLAVTSPAMAQVAITIQSANHVTIPGSTRSLYANVQGTPDLSVNWTSTGGCTLASSKTNSAPQIITAPAAGGTCGIQTAMPTNEAPNFTSPVSCTITATSAADASKSAKIVIPVCAPPVTLTTFPTSTVLFKNQYGVVQSDLRGSTETGVTWAITTNPGGAGALTGAATNRHAVFSAKAPGTYVVTATSVADPKKKAFTTLYVTPHDLPPPTADHTEAVDCTAVGKGTTFEVGPAREFHDLLGVPWNTLKAGDTVRIHNDDTTGTSPTIYRQRVAIKTGGNPAQPIRICGVPDAHGVKPIIDGSNGTTRPDGDWGHGGLLEPFGVVSLYDAAHKFDIGPNTQQNIAIEGLHIRNANATFSYVKQTGGVVTPYGPQAACIRLQTGRSVLIRGNDLDTCAQAIFSNSTTPEGAIIYDLTVEGNYIHDWGTTKSERQHAMYLQGIGLTVQFNYFAAALPDVPGNVIKSRSVLNFLRWNFISQSPSTSRAFDLVEPQSYVCYIIPYKFAVPYHAHDGAKSDCYPPRGGAIADPLPPNQVAANFEAYHADYVYGNTLVDAGSGSAFVHYGYDQQTQDGPGSDRRAGTLFYWNNTHLLRGAKGVKQIFDLFAPDALPSYEYPKVESLNNVFATGGEQYQWTRGLGIRVRVDSTWIAPGSILPDRAGRDTYQGGVTTAEAATCDPYGRCKPSNGHLQWLRDGKPGNASLLYLGPTPFDPNTFMPGPKLRGLAVHLPKGIQDQPSNMEYVPATNTIKPRQDDTYIGSLD